MRNMVQWELGYEENVDPAVAAEFGLENRDDLDAINVYVQDLVRRVEDDLAAGRVDRSTFEKWTKLKDDWFLYYQKIVSSWYVSDEDLAFARKKRDDINKLLVPKEHAFVQRHAKEKKPALTPEEFQKWQEEGMPWWQKHWKAIAATAVGTIATAYLVIPRIVAVGLKAATKR